MTCKHLQHATVAPGFACPFCYTEDLEHQLELAYQVLEANGVPRTRTVHNSIEVLATRLRREEQARSFSHCWTLTDQHLSSPQIASVDRVISRCKSAHYVDLQLRINGQFEQYEADWVKHLTRVTNG